MALKVKVAQPCLTLFDPMDSTIYGIFQARTLEWVAISLDRSYFGAPKSLQMVIAAMKL